MSLCVVRGSINIDEFFHVDNIVLPGQTISSSEFERRGGGKGANQAAAVARAGGRVQLVGAVGDDGAWLVGDLKEMGVDVSHIQSVKKEPTGRAIIQLTPAGENCIILHKGTNYARTDSLDERTSLLSSAAYLLLQNEIPMQSTIDYLKGAKELGVQTVYNPSPMPSREELKAFPWHLISYLLVNEGEAQALLRAQDLTDLTGRTGISDVEEPAPTTQDIPLDLDSIISSARSTVKSLISLPAFAQTTVVCTLGGSGVLASAPSGRTLVHIPAAPLRGTVRDTTGAGDCFTGYFVAGLMQLDKQSPITSQDLAELLRFSAQAAGMCVEKHGAMESIPARTNVEGRLNARPFPESID